MRNPDHDDDTWAKESYQQFTNGLQENEPSPAHFDFLLEDRTGNDFNLFEQLAERFNEFFGHPSKT